MCALRMCDQAQPSLERLVQSKLHELGLGTSGMTRHGPTLTGQGVWGAITQSSMMLLLLLLVPMTWQSSYLAGDGTMSTSACSYCRALLRHMSPQQWGKRCCLWRPHGDMGHDHTCTTSAGSSSRADTEASDAERVAAAGAAAAVLLAEAEA